AAGSGRIPNIHVIDMAGGHSMDHAIIPEPLKAHIVGFSGPTELRDQSGCVLGVFTPAPRTPTDIPLTLEDLDAAAAEAGGKTLGEIWRSLGVQ
ncbi:MAG TPA: hypothetical protein PJ982_17480, partial [Lacipirellulaceae bacterium]|nr:hypothetical protein [Lacipirellulaceae bacterium]